MFLPLYYYMKNVCNLIGLRPVYTTEKIGTARIKRRTAPTKFDGKFNTASFDSRFGYYERFEEFV